MKIVIEAGSMAELRALLEEMTQVPVMAPKNINPPTVFTEAKTMTGPPATEYTVGGIGGTFTTAGEKPKKKEKAAPVPEPERTPEAQPDPALPVLTRDDVLARIKVVKNGTDPDIAEKVKVWLGKNGVEKLADCTNFQYHALIRELGL